MNQKNKYSKRHIKEELIEMLLELEIEDKRITQIMVLTKKENCQEKFLEFLKIKKRTKREVLQKLLQLVNKN